MYVYDWCSVCAWIMGIKKSLHQLNLEKKETLDWVYKQGLVWEMEMVVLEVMGLEREMGWLLLIMGHVERSPILC